MQSPGATAQGEIHRLPQEVVDQIAAGEVIQRPSSALKEMLENSLDAGSTQINVTVKGGGIKLLQIQDNGSGIAKADLPILCERFTTSKLKEYSDLQQIATFGFRGEALASISYVAKVTVTTMPRGSVCAYQASYSKGRFATGSDGKEILPKPIAGTQGTTIAVEGMFSQHQRKEAFKNASEEYTRIAEVVMRYSLNNPHCGFSCRRMDGGNGSGDVSTPRASTTLRNIGLLFGTGVSKEMLPIECDAMDDPGLAFRIKGYISSANLSTGRHGFILFINGRLVDCSSIKRGIQTAYSEYLPRNGKPFAVLSLQLKPENLDVNVHPTKKEVHFLNEEEVIARTREVVCETLVGQNASRTIYTQRQLSFANPLPDAPAPAGSKRQREGGASAEQPPAKRAKGDAEPAPTEEPSIVTPSKRDRRDKNQASLDSFMSPTSEVGTKKQNPDGTVGAVVGGQGSSTTHREGTLRTINGATCRLFDPDPKKTLQSVMDLLMECDKYAHAFLRSFFEDLTFVGCASTGFVMAQHGTGLYMLDLPSVTRDIAYQMALLHVGGGQGRSRIRLKAEPRLTDLLRIALDLRGVWPEGETSTSKEDACVRGAEILWNWRELLNEYFGIEIRAIGDEARDPAQIASVSALPQLIPGFVPPLARLPGLLLRIVCNTDWEEEKPCIDSIARALGDFSTFLDDTNEGGAPSPSPGEEELITAESRAIAAAMGSKDLKQVGWLCQHSLFPLCRDHLSPPSRWAKDGTVLQVACLENLYKVFERC